MPTFTFRLQPLLEQKLEFEKQAQINVVNKRRAAEEAQQLLSSLQAKKERLRLQLRDVAERVLEGTLSALEVHQRNSYREELTVDLTEAGEECVAQEFAVEDAELELDKAKAYLTQCSQEVEKLEKYRDKQKSQFEKDLERRERLEQDELGTVMHLSRREEL